MKVNYTNTKMVPMWNIAVGATFMAKRTHSDAEGVYMKIDHNNKYVRNTTNNNYAINLLTGQIREFDIDFKVTPLDAEVNVL